MDQKQTLQPVELMRRVTEALALRTLSFALGKKVSCAVKPVQNPPFESTRGIAIKLTSLDGRVSSIWSVGDQVWQSWLESWKASRKLDNETQAGKTLMLLLTGGLDKFQLLSSPDPTKALPAYPIPSAFGQGDILGWKKVAKSYFWFEIGTDGEVTHLGFEKQMLAILANRMFREPSFRDRMKEEVLGEACGELGASRPWEPSLFGKIRLAKDFVLGPCLLPEGGVFQFANPNKTKIAEGELLLVHTIGWADLGFDIYYRCKTSKDLKAAYNRLFQKSHTLLPFAQLLGLNPSTDSWTFAKSGEGTTQTYLHLIASFENTDEVWDVFLPPELLNELAKHGNLPWNITYLNLTANGLLQVFLTVIDRFKLQPPTGFFRFAGTNWASEWFTQMQNHAPPPSGMTVSDLWSVLGISEKKILVQNILSVEKDLRPLQGLFSWRELDPQRGEVFYSPPGFNMHEFGSLLPQQLFDEFNQKQFVPNVFEEYVAANERALEFIWLSVKQRKLSITDGALSVLRLGFVNERRAWRLQKVRSWSRLPVAEIIEKAQKDPKILQSLQKQGAKNLAIALQNEEKLAKLIPSITSKAFGEEFLEQRRIVAEQDSLEGPDYTTFERARLSLESDLAIFKTKYLDKN